MRRARWWFTLGLVASCGGPPPPTTTAPTTAAVAAATVAEQFGPGLAMHDTSADEALGDVTRVLSASYKLTPSGEPGVVTTAWAEHDGRRWPGAETRLRVEVTAAKVIVYVQCRAGRESCARTVPAHIDLIKVAQDLANDIAQTHPADRLLRMFRTFKDEVCACDDKACVESVEKKMMEWMMAHMDEFKNIKPTAAQDAEADRIEDAMDACKEKIDPSAYSYAPPSYPSHAPPAITPRPPGGTGSAECDEYLDTFDDVMATCKDKLGPAVDAVVQSRNAQLDAFAAWNQLDAASRKATIQAAASGCKAAAEALRTSARSMGCPL